jgi:hypothetical protein
MDIPMTEPTDGQAEPTDEQIREQLQEHWVTKFRNWSGDSLNEAVMDLAVGDTEADEARVYDRACTLLTGAKITVVWPGANPVAAELERVAEFVQGLRENGESDLRSVLYHLSGRLREIREG